MSFRMSLKKWNKVGERFRQTVDPFLTTVFGVHETPTGPQPSRFDYRGTGCYFTYSGFPFVLTAKHVLARRPQPHHFFHGKGESSAFPVRSGYVWPTDAPLDIAIVGCFQTALDEAGIVPCPYTTLLAPSFSGDDAFYYCNGFPSANAFHMPSLGELSISGNAFIGKQAQLPKDFDPTKFFAVEYPSTTDPSGMSGSPVWNLRLHCVNEFAVWSPETASFAGVVHLWLPAERVLVATRVEHLRDFVPHAIEYLRVKYGWKDGDC
jgi:hypothetical protein